MTITKKPQLVESPLPEKDISALIEKGGSTAKGPSGRERKHPETKPQFIQLRLERDLLGQIDALIHQRKVKIPRHTWILEALYEKLEREGNTSN